MSAGVEVLGAPRQIVDVETFDDWVAHGSRLAAIESGLSWAIGDWLIVGELRFPDRYRMGVELTGLANGTLRNSASLARRVPLERRNPAVSWSGHTEVAHLPAADQVRLLAVAADSGLSRRALRAVVEQEAQDRHTGVIPPDTPGDAPRPADGHTAPDPGIVVRTCHVVEVEVDTADEDRAVELLGQVSDRLVDVLVGEGVRAPKVQVR